MQERQDAYLESLEALDAQNREWIERDYQRRRAEQDALAALWAKMLRPHERQMSAVGCYIFFSMALLAALALGFLMLVGKGIL
jgi:type VI protein secretion system component VasF